MMKYLETNQLPADTSLARRLPANLAFRYHVLPLSEDQDRVTVAMADPEDEAVRNEVASYFGGLLYVVQSDRDRIDAKLLEIWPETLPVKPLSVLVCSEEKSRMAGRIRADQHLDSYESFVGNFCHATNAQVNRFELSYDSRLLRRKLVNAFSEGGYDLAVVRRTSQTILDRFFLSSPEAALSGQIGCSVLIIQQPRWPLRQMLLALRFDQVDESAVKWAAYLASLFQAAVTILPITPLFPARYDFAVYEMLSPETVIGKRFHDLIQCFGDLQIPYLVHHHNDLPARQLSTEIGARNYDLVVIGAEPARAAERWLSGGLIKPLLMSAGCPVMITKSCPMMISRRTEQFLGMPGGRVWK
jgi:nucleotide-binding universal stress UspA family protein